MTDDEVVKLMMRDVKRVSRQAFFKYGVDADDVEQEAWIGILVAARKNRGNMEFPRTFLFTRILKAIGTVIHSNRHSKNNDAIGEVEIEADDTLGDPVFRNSGAKVLKGVSQESLNMLASLYGKGLNFTEYGEKTGKTRSGVHIAHKRAIERIRKNMGIELEA